MLAVDTPAPTALQSFFVHVLPAIWSLIGLALTVAVFPVAKRWLTAWAESAERGAAIKAIAQVGLRVEHLAEKVVAKLNAGLKQQILDASKDGVLSPEERTQILAEGMKLFKEALGEEGMTAIQEVLGIGTGMVESYLTGVLEQQVVLAKVQPVTMLNKAVTVTASPK